VATPTELSVPRFLFWCLKQMNLGRHSQTAAQPGLSVDFVQKLTAVVPPIAEQQQIADFLDWKTGQIDRLIAKKRSLLAALAEQRMAVITSAVTRGLDPTAPLKDSGIPWLGKVPKHWELTRVKFMTQILRGKFTHRPRNDPRFYDGEYPFVQTGDIARASKYVKSYSQTLNELGLSVSKQFPAGTLVMTIAANIGDMAIIDFDACFPDSIVGFVPESDVDLNYLYFLFVAMKQRLMMTAVLNTQLNLNVDRIASIEGVKPSLPEQMAIVEHLTAELKKVDSIVKTITSAIDRLTEYRTALVTAATTGKIDVRNVKIPRQA
jgi:type I restriction enzyme S subunit